MPANSTPPILLAFSRAVQDLLQAELQRPRCRVGQMEERLALGILRILSRRLFREQLLFRDYRHGADEQWATLYEDTAGAPSATGQTRLYRPAQAYLGLVLSRRLHVARKAPEEPTSMHRLLEGLAMHGPAAEGWPQARVARWRDPPTASASAPDFAAVAEILRGQVESLASQCNDPGSRDRRKQYGAFWLTIPDAAAEVAEELSLWDCCRAVPVPIERALDNAVRARLTDVLSALNSRYALLRSCGLDPEHWYDDETLSIYNLRDLKRLREAVTTGAATSPDIPIETLYAQAFAQLKGNGKRLAGFGAFTPGLDEEERAFACSPVGIQMMHGELRSLNGPATSSDEGPVLQDLLDADACWDDGRTAADVDPLDLRAAVDGCRGLRDDPVLHWCAQALLLAQRSVHGPDGILADAAFRQLVSQSGRYRATDDEALLNRIQQRLGKALADCYDARQDED